MTNLAEKTCTPCRGGVPPLTAQQAEELRGQSQRYICTQVLFAQLFPGASKSLTSMADRLVLDSSERDDRHGALLDADMTADALIRAPTQAR
jgi:DNA polymerase III epsilon subunit-like protein